MKKNKMKLKKKYIIMGIVSLILITGLTIFLISGKFSNNKDKKTDDKEITIALNGDDVIELNVFEDYTELGVKANIDGEDISNIITIDGTVDVNKPGTYEIVYIVEKDNKKASIKRTIKVVDNELPTLTLKGNEELTIYVGNDYADPGYEALDNVDGDITENVQVSGDVDSTQIGEYIVTYTVSDSSSNVATVTRKVKVIERRIATSADVVKPTTSGTGLPVLMYHFFYDASKGEKGNDANWMEISDFEAQMKYLSDNNFYFPTWDEVINYVNGTITLPEHSIVVTVDDGDITFINLAVPIIQKYNVLATSFAVTTWNGDWLSKDYNFPGSHVNVQSHSHDAHRSGANGYGRLVNMTYEEALDDVTKSRDLIAGGSTIFCYPFGHYNDTAIQALKDANYKLAFTTAGGRVYPGANPYTLPRVRMSRGITLQDFVNKVS